MSHFLNDNFLLHNDTAKTLFHSYAKDMPIIDYHCHLDPKEIYDNNKFANLTAAWLYGDHYKWRLMRANGIDERFITGDASDYEKFQAWAETVPTTIGNPIYSWTHLELQRFFGISLPLNPETAPQIWEEVNAKLASDEFKRRNIIKSSKVEIICTTDDPADTLEYHRLLAEEEKDFKVLPTFRPDKALNIDAATFNAWIDKLAEASGLSVATYADLVATLENRVTFFHEHGCRLSDHALDVLQYQAGSAEDCERIYQKRRRGEELTNEEVTIYRSELLTKLIGMYTKNNWTMQLHIHALRNNNKVMFDKLGPDTGYDAVNDLPVAASLSKLLDRSEQESGLPKTVLYSLNPSDYPVLIALLQCYQKDVPGKFQLGSGWWFNDTWSGMREQITRLADGGLLYRFVGMLTDSRSFLSYTRHEYFRRVLCGWLGELDDRGEAPDTATLGEMTRNIAYNNASTYFGFGE